MLTNTIKNIYIYNVTTYSSILISIFWELLLIYKYSPNTNYLLLECCGNGSRRHASACTRGMTYVTSILENLLCLARWRLLYTPTPFVSSLVKGSENILFFFTLPGQFHILTIMVLTILRSELLKFYLWCCLGHVPYMFNSNNFHLRLTSHLLKSNILWKIKHICRF